MPTQKVGVSVSLKFEGTIHNHTIKVAGTTILTTNNTADNVEVTLSGNPVKISGRFKASGSSKVKTFDVTINGKSFPVINTDAAIQNELLLEVDVPYSFFGLNGQANAIA